MAKTPTAQATPTPRVTAAGSTPTPTPHELTMFLSQMSNGTLPHYWTLAADGSPVDPAIVESDAEDADVASAVKISATDRERIIAEARARAEGARQDVVPPREAHRDDADPIALSNAAKATFARHKAEQAAALPEVVPQNR